MVYASLDEMLTALNPDAAVCQLRILPRPPVSLDCLTIGALLRLADQPRHFSSFLCPPFSDVVKTRLQVEARTGQTNYKGLTDAFVKICE